MEQLIQTIIGLADGLIFALVALGHTLVYGIIEPINFADGACLRSSVCSTTFCACRAEWHAHLRYLLEDTVSSSSSSR